MAAAKGRVGLDLPRAEYDELKALAASQSRPVTTLVRYWVREAMQAERSRPTVPLRNIGIV